MGILVDNEERARQNRERIKNRETDSWWEERERSIAQQGLGAGMEISGLAQLTKRATAPKHIVDDEENLTER